MLLIEVFVPRGTLDEEERESLGRRLIDTLMVEDDSHAMEILDAQRTITQVLVHEPASWVLGQRPLADPADPPRYLVRVTVPGSWRKEMAASTVEVITGVLAETERAADRDPERVRHEPHAVILVDGISEGGIGFHGRAMSSLDLTEFVSRSYRDRTAAEPGPPLAPGADADADVDAGAGAGPDVDAGTGTGPDVDAGTGADVDAGAEVAAPRGTLVDPICGMSVELDDSALTLVHQGVLYGFCHGLCRRAFADEHGVPLGR